MQLPDKQIGAGEWVGVRLKKHHTHHTHKACRICERQISIPDVYTIPFAYNTRFTSLVNTNDPPEGTDRHFVSRSLESAQSVSASLNTGILAMKRALEEMETAHATVIKTIAQHEAILNPLRSIPDDILLAIFQWSSSSDSHGLDSMSSSRAPWTLSHVCRRWRNLSISSPRLWTNININSRDLKTSTRHERDRMSFKLDLHVRRSAECDLFVRVISHLRNRVTFLDECFGLLLPTAHRWKTLSVSVHSSALALQLAESRFERLTKMEINLWEPIRQVPWHVPNIRDLRLPGRPFEAVDFPWESITSYV